MTRRQWRRIYLREWRDKRGYTQQELADAIGVTKTHISNIENGKRQYTQEHLEAAAKFLGFDAEQSYYLLMDPTDDDGPWAMLDAMRNAPPGRVTDIRRIAGALVRDEGRTQQGADDKAKDQAAKRPRQPRR